MKDDVIKERINQIITYKDVLDFFGEKKIISRYKFIYDFIKNYIAHIKDNDSLVLCDSIIDHVVVDYFVDIMRIKPFQEIEFINDTKIYAYMSYWLLRHKPIQLKHESGLDKFVFINEELVSALLQSHLFDNADVAKHAQTEQTQINEFVDLMLYFFKYRHYTAQNIELMLTAFNAGRSYQTTVDFRK